MDNKNGCPDCGNTRKLELSTQRYEQTYNTLCEKIDILNVNIVNFTTTLQSHEVHIATINTSLQSLISDFSKNLERNSEDHRQIHAKIKRENEGIKNEVKQEITKIEDRQYKIITELNKSIGQKTMTPVIISIVTLIVLIITVIVTYIK